MEGANPLGMMIFAGLAMWMFASAWERTKERGKPSLLWALFAYALVMILYWADVF